MRPRQNGQPVRSESRRHISWLAFLVSANSHPSERGVHLSLDARLRRRPLCANPGSGRPLCSMPGKIRPLFASLGSGRPLCSTPGRRKASLRVSTAAVLLILNKVSASKQSEPPSLPAFANLQLEPLPLKLLDVLAVL